MWMRYNRKCEVIKINIKYSKSRSQSRKNSIANSGVICEVLKY